MKKMILLLCIYSFRAIAVASAPANTVVMTTTDTSANLAYHPPVLEEGIQTSISENKRSEFVIWANNSKDKLLSLSNQVEDLSVSEKVEFLEKGIQSIVMESSPRNSELIMRYILNRALVLNSTLDKEMDANSLELPGLKLQILTASIKLALTFSTNDLEYLKNLNNKNKFGLFALEYHTFLRSMTQSILDASAEYAFTKYSISWLLWDLSRDENSSMISREIIGLDNLNNLLVTSTLDKKSLSLIKLANRGLESMDLNSLRTKIETISSKNGQIGLAPIL